MGSRVKGLLSRLEKCSPPHSVMVSLSLSKVMPSEKSKGMVVGYDRPSRAHKELNRSAVIAVDKLLDFICLTVLSTILYFSEVPLAFTFQVFEGSFFDRDVTSFCHSIKTLHFLSILC